MEDLEEPEREDKARNEWVDVCRRCQIEMRVPGKAGRPRDAVGTSQCPKLGTVSVSEAIVYDLYGFYNVGSH